MIQNLAIVGLDRKQSYEIAKLLAQELDLYFFDCLELFEFDNIPRTFKVMLEDYGQSYFRKKEKSIIGYASSFNNCVINLESGMAENNSNFTKIKKNCLLIYIHSPASVIHRKLQTRKYNSEVEKKFYNISPVKIQKRIKSLKENSDIIVNASFGSSLKIVSEILRKINIYYLEKTN